MHLLSMALSAFFIIVSKLTLFYGEGYLSLSVGIETDKKGNNSTMKPKGRISVNMLE
ncbi:hypothetical protein MPG29_02555 [Helicobacter pylori]|nr:hypothetical protein MPG29_02555 [Helicobacter pylori]